MIKGEDLKGIEIDKCTDSYTVKIPEILKHHLESLPAKQKTSLKEDVLLTIARHIHEYNFNPAKYLSSRD